MSARLRAGVTENLPVLHPGIHARRSVNCVALRTARTRSLCFAFRAMSALEHAAGLSLQTGHSLVSISSASLFVAMSEVIIGCGRPRLGPPSGVVDVSLPIASNLHSPTAMICVCACRSTFAMQAGRGGAVHWSLGGAMWAPLLCK